MSFLTRMLATANPNDERYWQPAGWGPLSAAGVPVSAEHALKLSTWWACTRLIVESVAMLPKLVYERLDDGGRRRAENHPLYDVLHLAPNARQTPVEFFDLMAHNTLAAGNGLARIVAGPRGFADQLQPISPEYVTFDKLADGSLRYTVREPGKPPETLGDADVLHVKGMSRDGLVGQSVVSYARDSIGLGLAQDHFGARYFANSAEPRGVLKTGKTLSPEAAKRVKESWDEAHRGPNQHRIAVLEEGLDYVPVSFSNKDSQLIESREYQAEDICRWHRVPPHMVGLTSKATSWGSGIEVMGIGFVVYTLMPWLTRFQQAIARDLILAPRKYFVEIVVDALLRGDLKGRYDAYAVARQWGWLSPNDIRRLENLNPIEGGDRYDTPMNMMDLTQSQPQRAVAAELEIAAGPSRADLLAWVSAGRVVRKEVAALTRAARKLEAEGGVRANGGGEAWGRAVHEFYADHAEFVADSLGVSLDQAGRYVTEQIRALRDGPDAMADWETRRVADLAQMCLEAA